MLQYDATQFLLATGNRVKFLILRELWD